MWDRLRREKWERLARREAEDRGPYSRFSYPFLPFSYPNGDVFGPHFGKGPKSYKRSDERIADDLNDRLTFHPDIDASDIEVRVKDSEVTLAGSVDSRFAKRLAEEIAEAVPGVMDVHNQIKVIKTEVPAAGKAA